jgi:hypothetical protein
MLLSFGCIFIFFMMSCFWIAKEADEKIDQFGPSLYITHEGLKLNTHVGIHTVSQSKVRWLKSASPAMEIETEAKETELFCDFS